MRKKIIHRIVDILFWLSMGLLIYVGLLVLAFASFRIPGYSMEPTLTAGDNILVSKPVYGARIFNLFASLRGEETAIYRLPGLRNVRRNDVIVFNFPHARDWDTIGMDIMVYHVKRCIGLPGDTVTVRNGFYKAGRTDLPLGNQEAQLQLSLAPPDSLKRLHVFAGFPEDSILNWNMQNMGPLYIPAKGDWIAIDRTHAVLYRRVIEWEQKKTLEAGANDTVYLGGEPLAAYTFRHNYYFVAGDNMLNSQDSRYWGLLPEEYIVGKACLIWKSTDPYTGKLRRNRVLKRIR